MGQLSPPSESTIALISGAISSEDDAIVTYAETESERLETEQKQRRALEKQQAAASAAVEAAEALSPPPPRPATEESAPSTPGA